MSLASIFVCVHVRDGVGVFVGTMTEGDWSDVLGESTTKLRSPFAGNAGGAAALAGRVSFVFGLKGPALSTSTVCSSSLVALDAACQALTLARCSAAIVGSTVVVSLLGLLFINNLGIIVFL